MTTVFATHSRPDLRKAAGIEDIARTYVGVVYAAARRQMGDPEHAADVTQAVFLILRHKWDSLDDRTVMSAWLLRVTRYACNDAKKLARRRAFHERRAATMRIEQDSPPAVPDLPALGGRIDDALDRLSEADRAALVLAYIDGLPHDQVGRRLGISVQAAHKRIQRGVGKLRRLLGGGAVTPAVVGAALAAVAAPAAAPAAVTAGVLQAVGGAPATASVIIAQETLRMLTLSKVKAAAALVFAAAVALGGAGLVVAQGARPAPAPPPGRPAAAVAAAGGPETRELTLHQDGAGNRFIADLDTGRTRGAPDQLTHKYGLLNWAAADHMDLGMDNDGYPCLFGFDLVAVAVDNARFETLDAERLVRNVGFLEPGSLTPMSARGPLPVSYYFKTREGGMGALQITGVQDGRPGSIAVRYRLLDASDGGRIARSVAAELLPVVGREVEALAGDRGAEAAGRARAVARYAGGLVQLLRSGPAAAAFGRVRRLAEGIERPESADQDLTKALAELRDAWAAGSRAVQEELGNGGQERLP